VEAVDGFCASLSWRPSRIARLKQAMSITAKKPKHIAID
jgi:hypothetical protein